MVITFPVQPNVMLFIAGSWDGSLQGRTRPSGRRQRPDGLPHRPVPFARGGPAWPGRVAACLWQTYPKNPGDEREKKPNDTKIIGLLFPRVI